MNRIILIALPVLVTLAAVDHVYTSMVTGPVGIIQTQLEAQQP